MVKKGDILKIPIKNGKFVIGQVIRHETRTLRSVSCGLFDILLDKGENIERLILDKSMYFSTLLVLDYCLRKKRWEVIGNQKLKIIRKHFPYEKQLKKGGNGARVHDPESVEGFLNAFYGLSFWDDYYKPDLLDEMLISPDKKPSNLIYKNK